MWSWLNSNSSALQGIAALVSAVLGLVTIGILVITWLAIKRQAKAAEEQAAASRILTEAANEQTNASVEAAASAKKQSELLAAQLEQSVAPLLTATLITDSGGVAEYRLRNIGPGVAFKILYWLGGYERRKEEKEIVMVTPSTMSSGESAPIRIDRRKCQRFTLMYKGADRCFRFTEVRCADGQQEHLADQGLQTVYLS